MTHQLAMLALAMPGICLPLLKQSAIAPSKPPQLSDGESRLLAAINRERRQAGLSVVVPEARLFAAARGFAAGQADGEQKPKRSNGPTLVQRALNQGHPAVLGAVWDRQSASPELMVRTWMAKPERRRDLLSPMALHVGVAVARASDGTHCFVAVFGAPARLAKDGFRSTSAKRAPSDATRPVTQSPSKQSPADALGEQERRVVDLVNEVRRKEGLPPLRLSSKLAVCARKYTQLQARMNQSGHGVDGTTLPARLERESYAFQSAGENVAASQRNAAEAMECWLKSPPHRGNILSAEYEEIGVGCARAADGSLYWTQLFAAPR